MNYWLSRLLANLSLVFLVGLVVLNYETHSLSKIRVIVIISYPRRKRHFLRFFISIRNIDLISIFENKTSKETLIIIIYNIHPKSFFFHSISQ